MNKIQDLQPLQYFASVYKLFESGVVDEAVLKRAMLRYLATDPDSMGHLSALIQEERKVKDEVILQLNLFLSKELAIDDMSKASTSKKQTAKYREDTRKEIVAFYKAQDIIKPCFNLDGLSDTDLTETRGTGNEIVK